MIRTINLLMTTLIVTMIVGCGGKNNRRLIQPDPKFSYNLVEVPVDWPNEDKDWPEDIDEALIRQQAYEKYGTPDYFRLIWFRDERLASEGDIKQLAFGKSGRKLKEYLGSREREWVYLDKEMILHFERGKMEIRDLTDEIETISQYGDPHAIRMNEDVVGGKTRSFTYYDTGKIYYFRDGKKVREEDQQAMPGMMMRD